MTGPKRKSDFLLPEAKLFEKRLLLHLTPKIEQFAKSDFLYGAGTQICRGFKEHDLITCETKVQVINSLGR